MNTAELLLQLVRVWLMTGAGVAVVFLTIGIDRVDEDARGAYVFRPLLLPGILLIWPLVLWRWFVLETGRGDPFSRYHPVRRAHDVVAVALAVAIVGVIAVGFSVRQEWPADVEPVRLSDVPEADQ